MYLIIKFIFLNKSGLLKIISVVNYKGGVGKLKKINYNELNFHDGTMDLSMTIIYSQYLWEQ